MASSPSPAVTPGGETSPTPGASPSPTASPTPDGSPTPTPDVDNDSDGYTTDAGDCDDGDANTYPGAPEIGDGEDNNCNGEVDEGLDTRDEDHDSYSIKDGDCDDLDPGVNPGELEVPYDAIDQDCSGSDLTDVDGDGHDGGSKGDDCDDLEVSIHPGAQEVPYDGIDQDCSSADLTDVDGDGHDGDAFGDDCDDKNADRYPGHAEIAYDGIDQDCSGQDLTDVDGDGFDGIDPEGGATPPDCNDQDGSINPNGVEIPYDSIDQDCSGADLTDVDGDGVDALEAGGADCNDDNQNTFPGAPEYADGEDNNCDGLIDNDLNTFDDDGDGSAEADGDCDDTDSTVYPSATETPYDNIDQDCDGTDLVDVDQDGFAGGPAGNDCDDNNPSASPAGVETAYDGIDQDCSGGDLVDVDQDGFAAAQTGGGDCNDDDAQINPGASEKPYNGIDEDCSGKDLTDVDADGYDASSVTGGTDCNDANPAINPRAAELCDGLDNNCDNVVDTDAIDRDTYYVDADHDSYGNPSQPVQVCTATTGQVADSSDCDDTTNQSYPGAKEVCDSRDNDCNGSVDEGVSSTFYKDSDGDGYGDAKSSTQACSLPAGYSANNTDCDDTHKSVYPNAPEICDALDNNCNSQIDEGVLSTFYQDSDEDGYGNPTVATQACSAPTSYVKDNTDCNDKNSDINPGAPELCNSRDDNCNGKVDDGVTTVTYYQDKDADGYGNSSVTQSTCTAAPAGYVSLAGDCNDSSASINPAAKETCNAIDDNCNAQIDEGVKPTWYQDKDGDTFGSRSVSQQACVQPSGYVADNTDCDDNSSSVNPNAKESCNGIDDNCSGVIDEGVSALYYADSDKDGFGNPASSTQACQLPTGYVSNNTDCNDSLSGVYPGAAEACNGIDDDCDTVIDDGVKTTFYKDNDGDGYGQSGQTTQACNKPSGYAAASGDCNDGNALISPAGIETCNGADDNCNGQTDESGITWYRDADVDGYGNPNVTVSACSKPTGYVNVGTDCNDATSAVNPGATELCNYIDDNCNGGVDENVTTTYYQDKDGDGFGNVKVLVQNCIQPAGYVLNGTDCDDTNAAINPATVEQANLKDDNCNGQIDEGVGTNCRTILLNNPTATSGYYNIDPDGDGSGAAFSAYCDMTTAGGGWTRIYYQSTADGNFFAVDQFEVNKNNPTALRYAVLKDLEFFRRNGGFEFKMDWPSSTWTDYMHWTQSSNPVTDNAGALPTGYTGLHVPYSSYNGWGGLQRSNVNQYSLLDGTLSPLSNWYFAVGTTYAWNAVPNAQPGPTGGVTIAELWVR